MAKVGKPPKFNSPEHLQSKIDVYVKDCNDREVPLTIEGLAVACDCDRQTILNYSYKDEYFGIIKKYREMILAKLQEGALSGKLNPAMTIFNLKNNYGYADKQEIKTENTTQVHYYAPQKDKDK